MSVLTCKLCGKECASLRGWKRHMSSHGGFSDADLQEIAGISPSGDVKTRMESFAESLPIDSEPVTISTDGTVHPINSESQNAAPPPPEAKRIKATPKKLKKLLGGIPAKILAANDIQMDADDDASLEEAAEFLADVFGFEFSVPESKYVIESRWFAVVWVGGITLLIFLKHKAPELFAWFKDAGKIKDKKDGKNGEKKEAN